MPGIESWEIEHKGEDIRLNKKFRQLNTKVKKQERCVIPDRNTIFVGKDN